MPTLNRLSDAFVPGVQQLDGVHGGPQLLAALAVEYVARGARHAGRGARRAARRHNGHWRGRYPAHTIEREGPWERTGMERALWRR